ncbi:MAG: ABC transporter ATP-binding protein [Spirochaetes bacterium]|nr:ABC transporter ATP-binding protein [Spirochaetota bacterium]
MNDEIIVCRNIKKNFITDAENLLILRSVNCVIKAGETVSIVGPSGCGKSTLLSIIGGLDKPSSGELEIQNWQLHLENEEGLSDFRAKEIGFVFQFHYLLKDFSALENVLLPGFMAHGDQKAAEEQAKALLEQVGLSNRMHHVPAKMSGGERQRVAIARAMINRPAILLADEPTGNLDEGSAAIIEEILFSLAESWGTTLVVVTHDARMAARAKRRFRMHEGEIFEE